MMRTVLAFLTAALLLSACGYRGDLYLPKDRDRARFAPVQTGLQFTPIAPMPNIETQPTPPAGQP